MKQFLFIFVLALAICFGGTNGYAQENGGQTPVTVIIINTDSISQPPRTPILVPISGYVLDNAINLFFSSDLGEVSIRLEDSMGQTLLSTSVDTYDGSESLPFNGEPGSYTIYFILEDNTSYIGRFELI